MAEIFLWSQIKNKKATFIPNIYGQKTVEMNYLEVKEWLNVIKDNSILSDNMLKREEKEFLLSD